MPPTSLFYLPGDDAYIPMFSKFHKALEEQEQDNDEAMDASLEDAFQQPPGSRRGKERFAAIFYEGFLRVSTERLCQRSGFDESKLAEIRYKEPIYLYSCLQCYEQLPEVDRRTHLCRGQTMRYLRKFEVGSPAPVKRVCELLCDTCAQEVYECLKEEHRQKQLALQARRKELRKLAHEDYAAYLQTPELRAKKSRVHIRAGNRCVICGPVDKPLDVHHNSYDRLGGDELLVDFALLCRDCHSKHHGSLPEAA
jgi:hypothetical protein